MVWISLFPARVRRKPGMSKFGKLSEAFEQNKGMTGSAKLNDIGALRHSLAVICAIDKLKNQGIEITKKAKMDYLLALQFVEKASKTAGRDLLEEYLQKGEPGAAPTGDPSKRNPAENPAEFERAFKEAMKVTKEVEDLQRQGKPVPEKQMATYTLCKKFLEKYT